MRARPETLVRNAIQQQFEVRGWWVIHFEEDHTRGTPGIPDLLVQSPPEVYTVPVFLWVEVKRPPSQKNKGGHVRKKQREFILRCWERGTPAMVADSQDPIIPIASGEIALDGWFAMRNPMLVRRAALISGVSVVTTIPSSAMVVQAVLRPLSVDT